MHDPTYYNERLLCVCVRRPVGHIRRLITVNYCSVACISAVGHSLTINFAIDDSSELERVVYHSSSWELHATSLTQDKILHC